MEEVDKLLFPRDSVFATSCFAPRLLSTSDTAKWEEGGHISSLFGQSTNIKTQSKSHKIRHRHMNLGMIGRDEVTTTERLRSCGSCDLLAKKTHISSAFL